MAAKNTTEMPSFEQVYQDYYHRLLAFVRSHVDNPETAQDIVQAVFLSCYRNWDSFDMERGGISAWLYCIARNKLKNHYRDLKDHVSIDALREESTEEPIDYLAHQKYRLMEDREILARALNRLPRRNRDVVILRYFAGHSNQEIASAMQLSHENVRVILSRSLQNLAQYLIEDGYTKEDLNHG